MRNNFNENEYTGKKMQFYTIIEGFFYSSNPFNAIGTPYVNVSHPHDFVITADTFHTRQKRLLRTCSVLTSHGKRDLVITRIMHTDSPVSRHIAQHLYPVLNFHNRGMGNTHLTETVCQHSDVEQTIRKWHRANDMQIAKQELHKASYSLNK